MDVQRDNMVLKWVKKVSKNESKLGIYRTRPMYTGFSRLDGRLFPAEEM
jgi:hypothetical protein